MAAQYFLIYNAPKKTEITMSFDPILALIAIIFGILVIVFEDLLSWIVGIFFILVGLWLLWDYYTKRSQPARGSQKGQQSMPPSEERR